MNLMAPLLAAALGALFGTCVGVLLMQRNVRPPISEGDLAALKARLDTNQSALEANANTIADLRDQAEQREALLKRTNDRVEAALDDSKKDAAARAAAEQKIQEMFVEKASLLELVSHAEARAKDEKAQEIAALQLQLEAGHKQIEDLHGSLQKGSEESAELKGELKRTGDRAAALEADLAVRDEHIRRLAEELADSQEAGDRTVALEAELAARDQRIYHLNLEITELQEDKLAAAKAMELLLMAQQKLARAFQPAEPANGVHVQTTEPARAFQTAEPANGVHVQTAEAARAFEPATETANGSDVHPSERAFEVAGA